MADNYGVWTGVGTGLGEIGKALQQRGVKLDQDREKQADKFESDARDIARNIAQAGGPQVPGNQAMVQQLYRTVQMHNALYPAHETPALIARIGRFLGKQPGAPREDPRASMTPEQLIAGAQTTTTKGQQTLEQQYNEIFGIMKRLHPGETDQEIQARVEPIMFQQKSGASDSWEVLPGTVPQQDPATKKWYIQQMERKSGEVREQEVPAQHLGLKTAGGAAKPGTPAFFLQLRFPGRDLSTLSEEEYNAAMEAYNESKDTSVAGRAARYLARSGQASDVQAGYDLYAKQQYLAQQAKAELAQGQIEKMDPEKMKAMALANLRASPPNRTNPFGRTQGAMRTQYAMAVADIEAGGAGLIMAQQATAAGLTGSITNLIEQRGTRDGAEKRLVKALDLMEENSKKVGKFGGTMWNDLFVVPQGDIREYPELAALRNAVETAVNDYALAVGSSGATGGRTTDNATNHAREVLNVGMSQGTMSAVAAQMKKEAVNALAGTDEAIKNAQDALQDLGNQPAPGQQGDDLRQRLRDAIR